MQAEFCNRLENFLKTSRIRQALFRPTSKNPCQMSEEGYGTVLEILIKNIICVVGNNGICYFCDSKLFAFKKSVYLSR